MDSSNQLTLPGEPPSGRRKVHAPEGELAKELLWDISRGETWATQGVCQIVWFLFHQNVIIFMTPNYEWIYVFFVCVA